MEKNIEIKYTTDGKKVVVIGDLNQTEKIVQEIYVTKDGDEIPAGERFVVKTLLDEPLKTWEEKKLESLKETFERSKANWEDQIQSLNQEKELAYNALKARVKWLRNVAKQPHPESLKRVITNLADFLSPVEKWVVVCDYRDWYLEKFNEEGVTRLDCLKDGYYGPKYDSMRLLSLYGKSNGDLEWRINGYSDGSGSDTDVAFFQSKEDALLFLQNKLDAQKFYSSSSIENAKKYGLKLDSKKLDSYTQEEIKRIERDIESVKKDLAMQEKNLEKIKSGVF